MPAVNCFYCGTTIASYPLLEDHVVAVHGVSRHEIRCGFPECNQANGIKFESLQKRRAHYRKSHGDKP